MRMITYQSQVGLEDVDPSVNIDWQDQIYRTANISQYQLSLDGGNESTTFLFKWELSQ